ncbi:MAG: Hsp20/alpha crystallin family protein [Candidatus Makaraimicrobium thalassicum]|nr:MAG: Hsp20/alpha crystallin family protein [Candidatus Omnitrophota bacterium]
MKMWRSKSESGVPASYEPHDLFGASLEEIFGDFFRDPFSLAGWGSKIFPALDVHEKDDRIVIKSEIPGMDKKAIGIRLEGTRLTISGEKKSEKKDKKDHYYHEERIFGRFQRTIDLPPGIKAEEVNASYKDGILTIDIPRSGKKSQKGRDVEVR